MNMKFKSIAAAIGLCLSICIIAYDSLPHFDESLIQLKRNHRSAQRNWNVFYSQQFVYNDSSFRYQKDFDEIATFLKPNHLLFTDLATSYYASSTLPIFVRNVHRHQDREKSRAWANMLNSRSACYLGIEEKFSQFKEFLISENHDELSDSRLIPKYAIANKDLINQNLRYDCLWNGRQGFISNIEKLATLRYEGKYLNLYEFDKF